MFLPNLKFTDMKKLERGDINEIKKITKSIIMENKNMNKDL